MISPRFPFLIRRAERLRRPKGQNGEAFSELFLFFTGESRRILRALNSQFFPCIHTNRLCEII